MRASFDALSAMIKVEVIPSILKMNAALLANPYTAIAAALVAVGIAMYAYSDSVSRAVVETKAIINISTKATEAIQKQTEEILKRNAALGVTLTSLKKGVIEEAVLLKQEQDKLTAYEKVYSNLKEQNAEREKSLQYMSTEWLANRNNLSIYEDKVIAQRNLVKGLQEQVSKQNEINRINAEKKNKTDEVKDIVDAAKRAENSLKFKSEFEFNQNVKTPKIDIRGLGEAFKDKSIKANIDVQIADDALASSKLKLTEQMASIADILKQGAIQIGLGFTNALGESFVTSELDLRGIYQMFSQLANAIAMQLIAIGTAMLIAPGVQPMAWAYIGAGAALGLVAGVASGLAKSSGSGNQNTTTVAPQIQSPNVNGFRNQNNSMDLNTKVKGNDLLIIVDGAGRIRRR
jgi:hypothetical protein